MKFLITILLATLTMASAAHAACSPYIVIARKAVEGKTYVGPNQFTLIFGLDGRAAYGSPTSGHPGGTYRWTTNCHGQIKLYFQPQLGPSNTRVEILSLVPAQLDEYDVIHDPDRRVSFRLLN